MDLGSFDATQILLELEIAIFHHIQIPLFDSLHQCIDMKFVLMPVQRVNHLYQIRLLH